MNYKNIARLIPTIQSASLLKENLKGIPKKDGSGKGERLNKGRGGCEFNKVVGLGMKNMIGIELIKTESNLIESL